MIKRDIGEKVKSLLSKFPVVSITGPRQSGKTTLIKNLFPDYSYVSLEDLDFRNFAMNDPKGFLKNYEPRAIFDEIQRVPELFSYLQTVVDSNNDSKYIISGSQSFLSNENISQSLAGRIAILTLLPFSLSELKKENIIYEDYEEYIFKGFYPRLYDKDISPLDFYPNYIQTYVERDIRLIKNISNLNDFIKFIRLCAARVGQVLNYTSLANDVGIAVNTVKSWISVLESSFIIYLLKPYYSNFKKRITKMPKLYFYDTGLVSSLLGIKTVDDLKTHYLKGNLFENFVFTELIKIKLNNGETPNLYYWRDRKGIEIDCIIDKVKPTLIEIKSSRTINEHFFKNILSLKKNMNLDTKSFVIYGDNNDFHTSNGNIISWSNIEKVFD